LWKDPHYLKEGNIQLCLIWKLKELKRQTKIWQAEVKKQKCLFSENLEFDIKQLILKSLENPLSLKEEGHLHHLESNRNRQLGNEEET
jgi:hypothetical protein